MKKSYDICVKTYEKIEYRLYNMKKKFRLKNNNFSIITSNCNGSIMYHDLDMPYLTPTVNLTIGMNDFVKMAENLKWYMEQKMVELGEYEYPAGLLGDIRINFVHYKSFEEALEKWERRRKRINWDSLFLVGTARGDCTYETIKNFDQLPYENKVIFTNIEYPEFQSAYYIKGFEDQEEIGVLVDYKKQFLKRRYLDDFDYVAFLNGTNPKENNKFSR